MGGKGSGVVNERERMHRINELSKLIHRCKKDPREHVIAQFQYNYGLSRRKVLEYIKILVILGKINKSGRVD